MLKQCSLATHSQSTNTIRHSSPTCRDYSPLFATPQWPKSPGPPSTHLDPDRDNHMILPLPHSATWPLGHPSFVLSPCMLPIVLPWSPVHIYSPPVVSSFSKNEFPSPLLLVPQSSPAHIPNSSCRVPTRLIVSLISSRSRSVIPIQSSPFPRSVVTFPQFSPSPD